MLNPSNDVITGLGSDDRSCKIQKLVGGIDKNRQRSIATRPSTDGQTGPLANMPMPVNLGMFNSLNNCKTHKTFQSYTGSENVALPGEFKSCREDPTGDYRFLQNQRSYNPESLKQNIIQKTEALQTFLECQKSAKSIEPRGPASFKSKILASRFDISPIRDPEIGITKPDEPLTSPVGGPNAPKPRIFSNIPMFMTSKNSNDTNPRTGSIKNLRNGSKNILRNNLYHESTQNSKELTAMASGGNLEHVFYKKTYGTMVENHQNSDPQKPQVKTQETVCMITEKYRKIDLGAQDQINHLVKSEFKFASRSKSGINQKVNSLSSNPSLPHN